MDQALFLTAFQKMILLIMTISAPILLSAIVVGLAISIIQSVTQIQEQTLTFVPKLITIGIILLVMGPYFLNELINFFNRITEYISLIV